MNRRPGANPPPPPKQAWSRAPQTTVLGADDTPRGYKGSTPSIPSPDHAPSRTSGSTSMGSHLSIPPVCAPSPTRHASPLPSCPQGHPNARPTPDYCFIEHSPELEKEEACLQLALVAVVGGTRPVVTTGQVCRMLVRYFGIEEVEIHAYQPEDFLIIF